MLCRVNISSSTYIPKFSSGYRDAGWPSVLNNGTPRNVMRTSLYLPARRGTVTILAAFSSRIALLLDQLPFVARQEHLPVYPKRRVAIRQQSIVEVFKRKLLLLLAFVVFAQLQNSELSDRVDQVCWIKSPSFRLDSRRCFSHVRIVHKE